MDQYDEESDEEKDQPLMDETGHSGWQRLSRKHRQLVQWRKYGLCKLHVWKPPTFPLHLQRHDEHGSGTIHYGGRLCLDTSLFVGGSKPCWIRRGAHDELLIQRLSIDQHVLSITPWVFVFPDDMFFSLSSESSTYAEDVHTNGKEDENEEDEDNDDNDDNDDDDNEEEEKKKNNNNSLKQKNDSQGHNERGNDNDSNEHADNGNGTNHEERKASGHEKMTIDIDPNKKQFKRSKEIEKEKEKDIKHLPEHQTTSYIPGFIYFDHFGMKLATIPQTLSKVLFHSNFSHLWGKQGQSIPADHNDSDMGPNAHAANPNVGHTATSHINSRGAGEPGRGGDVIVNSNKSDGNGHVVDEKDRIDRSNGFEEYSRIDFDMAQPVCHVPVCRSIHKMVRHEQNNTLVLAVSRLRKRLPFDIPGQRSLDVFNMEFELWLFNPHSWCFEDRVGKLELHDEEELHSEHIMDIKYVKIQDTGRQSAHGAVYKNLIAVATAVNSGEDSPTIGRVILIEIIPEKKQKHKRKRSKKHASKRTMGKRLSDTAESKKKHDHLISRLHERVLDPLRWFDVSLTPSYLASELQRARHKRSKRRRGRASRNGGGMQSADGNNNNNNNNNNNGNDDDGDGNNDDGDNNDDDNDNDNDDGDEENAEYETDNTNDDNDIRGDISIPRSPLAPSQLNKNYRSQELNYYQKSRYLWKMHNHLRYRMHWMFSRKERTGVTAVNAVEGLLVAACGPKLVLYRWDGQQLIGVAFLDSRVHCLDVLVLNSFLCTGDLFQGLDMFHWEHYVGTVVKLGRDSHYRGIFSMHWMIDTSKHSFESFKEMSQSTKLTSASLIFFLHYIRIHICTYTYMYVYNSHKFGELSVIVSDVNGNLQIVYYDPQPKLLWSVQKDRLYTRASFHIGTNVSSGVVLKCRDDHFQQAYLDLIIHEQHFKAKYASQHLATDKNYRNFLSKNRLKKEVMNFTFKTWHNNYFNLLATLDGGLVRLVPVNDLMYTLLDGLQAQMVYCIEHMAGLNPKQYRYGMTYKDCSDEMMNPSPMQHYLDRPFPELKNIIDGDLIQEFLHLDIRTQKRLAMNLGVGVDYIQQYFKVIDYIQQVELATQML
ncbi:hypothetical protein RFI_12282 [Reticulomyxa filosa]|uniref:RSE1/DDB1/CPSF1 C-terminal domain-containing protein n=1 Tax=Reticulomyxa filosa TaxID=46433 RepID=X6NF02_RETFI|nr:hypothetical protein RFI_12282 [Reticulomyxa filosa]|eukprot:ETO24875.1 hypothetical protein RFI_12282 [Reticulomyxa filosa]